MLVTLVNSPEGLENVTRITASPASQLGSDFSLIDFWLVSLCEGFPRESYDQGLIAPAGSEMLRYAHSPVSRKVLPGPVADVK
jgi:hypothetical protein